MSSTTNNHPPNQQQQQQLCFKPLHPESVVQYHLSDDPHHHCCAKDTQYLQAILHVWKQEEEQACTTTTTNTTRIEMAPVTYFSSCNGTTTPLHGYFIRKQNLLVEQQQQQQQTVLFLHTAAGPHDVFLFYKAARLIQAQQDNIQVMIVDLYSDPTGWAWNDTIQRSQVQQQLLLFTNNNNSHPNVPILLRQRLQAAIHAATTIVTTSTTTTNPSGHTKNHPTSNVVVAAMGWCLGGHGILELARMQIPSIRCLVTFHGVFSNGTVPPLVSQPDGTQENNTTTITTTTHVLLCHGVQDPFVSDSSLEYALQTLEALPHCKRTSLLQLQDAKHGFTNPAQAFHPDPKSFGYNPEAAQKAWRQAMGLLQRVLDEPQA